MKNLLMLCLLLCSLYSCKEAPSNTEAATEEVSQDNGLDNDPDLLAITDVIHNFYKWYNTNAATIIEIDYVKPGKSTTLDMERLAAYHSLLKQSNCISQAYIDGDLAYLKNLEATAWKTEDVRETPLTGLDFERLFCAQDWDINYWMTAPVYVDGLGLGVDRITATLSGDEGGSPREQKFEVVKENRKWLITNIICAE
jgi:Protein of unknown function (DUF3828)